MFVNATPGTRATNGFVTNFVEHKMASISKRNIVVINSVRNGDKWRIFGKGKLQGNRN